MFNQENLKINGIFRSKKKKRMVYLEVKKKKREIARKINFIKKLLKIKM